MKKAFFSEEHLRDKGIDLEMFARQVVEGFITGLHKSPFHGFSVEFAEHRLYNSGESVKNIDWKLYGRTDKLFVKRFEEETNLRCQLVVDTSSSMYYPRNEYNKLIFSAYSAAALMHLFRRQRDAFGLSCFSDKLDFSSAAKSTGVHQKYLLAELDKVIHSEARGSGTELAASLHEIAELLHKRSMVIIFSDMLESAMSGEVRSDLMSALQHLRHNKHEVVVFNVLDHKHEVGFDFDNRPYRFVDLESGDSIRLNPSQMRDQYKQSIQSFRKELEMKCAQYRIDLIDADIKAGYFPVLEAYLIKRAKMIS